jgi:hypothetical protein
VAEEAEIDRVARAGAEPCHLLAHLIGIEHGAGQRSERTRGRSLGRQLPVHCTRHRRLHDGKLDLEQLDEATIRPHIRTIFGDRVPGRSQYRDFA